MQNINLTEKSETLQNIKIYFHIKNGQELLTFSEIEKDKFYCSESPVCLKNVDINALIPNKICSGEKNYKYFIGYLYDDYKIKSLHIMLLKTRAYVKSYDSQTKWVYFLTEDDKLLKKYNTI